jgi:hypothetical protein
LLHAPKTAGSQNRAFSSSSHCYVSSLENDLTWFVPHFGFPSAHERSRGAKVAQSKAVSGIRSANRQF